jgi:hypothetical protein
MAKIRNLVIYPSNQESLYALKSEYEWIGREVRVSRDELGQKLVVLALPSRYKKKDQIEAKLKAKREAFEEGEY